MLQVVVDGAVLIAILTIGLGLGDTSFIKEESQRSAMNHASMPP